MLDELNDTGTDAARCLLAHRHRSLVVVPKRWKRRLSPTGTIASVWMAQFVPSK
jgi:hypothetical protein